MNNKIREKECEICKETYIARGNRSKYCSKVCSPHFSTNPPIEKECATCKKTFISKAITHKYCSKHCGVVGWHQEQYSDDEKHKRLKARKKVNRDFFRSRPENKKKKNEQDRQYMRDHPDWQLKRRYGLNKEMFIKLYEEQGGICLGCDIKLVSNIILEEKKQYDDDPNLIEFVDYAPAWVDHDHSYDIEGKCSANPDSVRGLLCPSCNSKDVLNPESNNYIYGVDGDLNKIQLVMDLDFKKQLKKKAG